MLINTKFLENKRMPDILECIANLSSDEVFTPPALANSILDLLPSEVWSNPDLKFLDPSVKTGVFLREVARRLMVGLTEKIPDEKLRREHIFKNMLYGISITGLTSILARRTLYYSKNANSEKSVVRLDTPEGNIFYENTPHQFINSKCKYCGASETELSRDENLENHAYQFIHQPIDTITNMRFDVIIGNPPYQLGDGGHGASAMPIYQKFIEQAISLEPSFVSMIIPSRWFAGGKGLDDFRARMLADKRIKTLVDFPNAQDCFPGVEIKGGVMYFLWDSKHNGECEVVTMLGGEELNRAKRNLNDYDTFVRFNQSISIIEKVKAKNEETLEKKVSSRKPFGFATNFTDYKLKEFEGAVQIYARGEIGWVKRDKILINQGWIDKYKVFVSRAYGAGNDYPHQIIGKPIVGLKNTCCTETYLVINVFDKKNQAQNMESYIKTKFFRFLISIKKSTQDNAKDSFSFVPDLPMDEEWTDEKLYHRYEITKEEQDFIDSIVKPMN